MRQSRILKCNGIRPLPECGEEQGALLPLSKGRYYIEIPRFLTKDVAPSSWERGRFAKRLPSSGITVTDFFGGEFRGGPSRTVRWIRESELRQKSGSALPLQPRVPRLSLSRVVQSEIERIDVWRVQARINQSCLTRCSGCKKPDFALCRCNSACLQRSVMSAQSCQAA